MVFFAKIKKKKKKKKKKKGIEYLEQRVLFTSKRPY